MNKQICGLAFTLLISLGTIGQGAVVLESVEPIKKEFLYPKGIGGQTVKMTVRIKITNDAKDETITVDPTKLEYNFFQQVRKNKLLRMPQFGPDENVPHPPVKIGPKQTVEIIVHLAGSPHRIGKALSCWIRVRDPHSKDSDNEIEVQKSFILNE